MSIIQIEKLCIKENKFCSLSNFPDLPILNTLDISFNNLRSLNGLPQSMLNLQTPDLENNKLS